ncbi:hypothetical protein KUTeg_020602 [Tegillarca granosa]|uniref:Lipoma HMGIC fusion partner-like 3 protein n=1 Tax=Tegillarca granosa TaxID=220873 RepID=A0ABQ9EDN7_TEGGR|nr:hypothetical protein KUTeg_020602 [Tegillarca granosa]
MEREIEYSNEITKLHHLTYRRHSRAITAVWAIFVICYAILNSIAFIQPQWLGDTDESLGVGFFGLYESCERLQVGGEYSCRGDFMNFKSILNDSFRAASFLVGISALLFIFSIVCFIMFCFLRAATVLKICGWLQLLAALCIAAGCIVYPNGWDDPEVQRICGMDTDKYNKGRCAVRWAYVLAIVLIFDAFILAILAFVLAVKQANLMPKPTEEKAHMNGGFKSDSLGKQSSLGSSYQNQFESIPQKRDSLPDTLHEPEPQRQQRRVDYDNVNEDADIRL